MVRTRRPATNSVIRRMLRPLIVTRNDRVPQRACVRSRAEADAACVPATPVAGWLAVGAVFATGAGGVAVVTGVPAGVVVAGGWQTPFTTTFGAAHCGLFGGWQTPLTTVFGGWHCGLSGGWQAPVAAVCGGWRAGLFGGWQTPLTTVFGGWHCGLFGGWQTPLTTVFGGWHCSTGTQTPSFLTSPSLQTTGGGGQFCASSSSRPLSSSSSCCLALWSLALWCLRPLWSLALSPWPLWP